MRHLFNSHVEVLELTGTVVDGDATMDYLKITDVCDPYLGTPGELMCRLDLNFQRPGKDQPTPVVAGRSPDRLGLMFYSPTDTIRAGHLIRCLDGPVTGTFEIRVNPDPAVGFSAAHHMEVQIVEVNQNVQPLFPAGGHLEQ